MYVDTYSVEFAEKHKPAVIAQKEKALSDAGVDKMEKLSTEALIEALVRMHCAALVEIGMPRGDQNHERDILSQRLVSDVMDIMNTKDLRVRNVATRVGAVTMHGSYGMEISEDNKELDALIDKTYKEMGGTYVDRI